MARTKQVQRNIHGRSGSIAATSPKSKKTNTKSVKERRLKNFVEMLYKFGAKFNVSVAALMGEDLSSNISVAGVGFVLGKIRKKSQIHKINFISPPTLGSYCVNMEVAKNLQMSERIRPDELKVNEVNEVDMEVVSDVELSGEVAMEVVSDVGLSGDQVESSSAQVLGASLIGPNKTAERAGKSTKDSGAVKSAKNSGAVKSANDSGAVKSAKDSGAVKSPKDSGAVKSAKDSGAVKLAQDSGAVQSAKDKEAGSSESFFEFSQTVGLSSKLKLKKPKKKVEFERSKPPASSIFRFEKNGNKGDKGPVEEGKQAEQKLPAVKTYRPPLKSSHII